MATLLLSCAGCETSSSNNVEGVSISVYPEVEKTPYGAALRTYSRKASALNGFDTLYYLHATYLADPFKQEFEKRRKNILGDKDSPFMPAQGKVAVFVSVYSPTRELNDMTDPKLWTLELQTEAGTVMAKTVTKMKNKYEWQSYFPYIDSWSSEFLVVFDVPEEDQMPVQFYFANLEAKTHLQFP
jgi:hypothetical protein